MSNSGKKLKVKGGSRWPILKALIERDDWMSVPEVLHAVDVYMRVGTARKMLQNLAEHGEAEVEERPYGKRTQSYYRALR